MQSKIIILSLFSFTLANALEIQGQSFSSQSLLLQKQQSTRTFKSTTFYIQEESPTEEEIGWQLKDPTGTYQGVAANVMHEKNHINERNKVIVAVIDSGVDVNHEDLDGKIWINEKEIPNNQIDDDGNGYIDDVMGWNFIGAKEGIAKFEKDDSQNGFKLIEGDSKLQISHETLEITREVNRLRNLKESLVDSEIKFPRKLAKLLKAYEEEVNSERENALESIKFYEIERNKFDNLVEQIRKVIPSFIPTLEALQKLETEASISQEVQALMELFEMYSNPIKEIQDGINYYSNIANFYYNTKSTVRSDIVKDNPSDFSDKYYGNNNVIGPDSFHGTHVAGIIAATRGNNKGIQGVSNNAVIMPLRVVPDGDERDKDVANAIYYAVDNGAQIINMSFGKGQSPYKKYVFEAIKYAQEKNVLLVHAAGNENSNNDQVPAYPTYLNAPVVYDNWLEVAASDKVDYNLVASFSNYGKKTVDIFAPGVNILSTAPGNKYATASGTSMAAPVVSGIAASLLSFKSDLKVKEVKQLIIQTGTRYPFQYVYKRGFGRVFFSELSKFAIVPNLDKAVEVLLKSMNDSFERMPPVQLSLNRF